MKRLLFILFTIVYSLTAVADDVKFTASSPTAIPLGEVFQLIYTVNASGGTDFRVPDLPNFDVIAGPFTSSRTNMEMINGNVKTSVSKSYTYNLIAKKEGDFSIPAASIVVDKKKYVSNALSIKVLPEDEKSKAANNNRKKDNQSISDVLSDDNIFIRAIPSRTKLYEQDYLLITYKLYTTLNVMGFEEQKLPDFKGFLKQEIERPKASQWKNEHYKGKNYNTVVIYESLLFPQRSGTIDIDKAYFDAIVRVTKKAQMRSIFDSFFDTYQDVKKSITVPSIKIKVDKLPANKPVSFNGAVGSFDLRSDISSKDVDVNEAITLKFTISGNGNLKLIQNPDIKFPADFDVYDPKVNNNYKNTRSGVSGSKTIEYLIIPRNHGSFIIPSFTFSYFDIKRKSYKEIHSPEFKINVRKGTGSNVGGVGYSNKEQLKLLGKDIRYINTSTPSLTKKFSFFFGSLIYWLLIILPLIITIVLFVLYRKQLQRNADIDMVKNRKANKVAVKRLKTANKLLQAGQKEVFYEEILKALWGYLSDKLIIPVSSLTKENVAEELNKKKVDQNIMNELMDIISICEYERYSPSNNFEAMDELYKRTIDLISNLQEKLK